MDQWAKWIVIDFFTELLKWDLSTILQAQPNSSAGSDWIYRFIVCFVTDEYL